MPTFASLLHTSIRSFAVNTTASSKPYPVSTMHTASLDNSSRNTHTTAQDACANVASSAPIQFSSGVQPISIQRHYTQAVEVGLRIDLGADSIKGAQMNPFCSWRTPESRIEFLQSTLSSSMGSTFSVPEACCNTPISQDDTHQQKQQQQQCAPVDPLLWYQGECDLLDVEDLFESMPVTGQSYDLEQLTRDVLNGGGAVPAYASTFRNSLPGDIHSNSPGDAVDSALHEGDNYFSCCGHVSAINSAVEDDPPPPPVAQTVDPRIITSPPTHPMATPPAGGLFEPGNQSCSSVLVHMMDSKLAIKSPVQTPTVLSELPTTSYKDMRTSDWLEQQLHAMQGNIKPSVQQEVPASVPSDKVPRSTTTTGKAAKRNRASSSASGTKRPQPVRRTIHYCPFCNHSSNRSNNMKGHILTHFPDRPREFACETCFREFTRKHDLKRHWKTHNKDNRRDKKQQ